MAYLKSNFVETWYRIVNTKSKKDGNPAYFTIVRHKTARVTRTPELAAKWSDWGKAITKLHNTRALAGYEIEPFDPARPNEDFQRDETLRIIRALAKSLNEPAGFAGAMIIDACNAELGE